MGRQLSPSSETTQALIMFDKCINKHKGVLAADENSSFLLRENSSNFAIQETELSSLQVGVEQKILPAWQKVYQGSCEPDCY